MGSKALLSSRLRLSNWMLLILTCALLMVPCTVQRISTSTCMNRYTDRVVMCRLLNLELLLQFGPRAWQAHIKHLEVAQERCKTLYFPWQSIAGQIATPCMPPADPPNLPCTRLDCQTCMQRRTACSTPYGIHRQICMVLST